MNNLLPNGKFELWTVTWITNENGSMVMIEPYSKEEVIELLKELKDKGQDMNYVNVYPPKSNLTYEELEQYKEEY